jgi:hypothetical protein
MKAKLKHLIFRIEFRLLMTPEDQFAYLWEGKKPSLRTLIFGHSKRNG